MVSGHIEEMPNGLRMRVLTLVLCSLVAAAHVPSTEAKAQVCTDDYMTVDTFFGTIIDIVPAPEPFVSADMLLKGPDNCSPMWMQVLKADAAQCRIGDRIEARGIIVSDPENNAWNINPERNMYMRLSQDYSCRR
jgi:hypothetical protein